MGAFVGACIGTLAGSFVGVCIGMLVYAFANHKLDVVPSAALQYKGLPPLHMHSR